MRVLLVAADVHEEVEAVGAAADRGIARVGAAVAGRVVAAVNVEAEPVLLLLGDDVDDAGDRIGTVQRRGAVLQDLDAVDDAGRNRVEIDRRGNARRGRFIDPAQTVDQHQRALGAEVAQRDGRRTGTDAAAVRRKTEVAGGIEFGIERRAADRQLLENVADRSEAGLRDVFRGDRQDGRLALELGLPDARAGDLDRPQFLDVLAALVLGEHRNCIQACDDCAGHDGHGDAQGLTACLHDVSPLAIDVSISARLPADSLQALTCSESVKKM